MAFLDETGLAELWSLIKAEDAKGAKIATGSYKGTGTSGASNPCKLTFNFTPKVVMIYGGDTGYMPCAFPYMWGSAYMSLQLASYDFLCEVTVSGNTMSWYYNDAAWQLNASGKTYQYVAIG